MINRSQPRCGRADFSSLFGDGICARIKEELFEVMVPLPPLPEQQRIVARIEELAAKINEARELRQMGE